MNTPLVLQLAFTAFYTASWGAMFRQASLWFPFTPTFTGIEGQWVGLQDAVRFALAALFILLLPGVFFIYVLLGISTHSAVFSIYPVPPSLADAWKIFIVFSLLAPQLGFYNVWQVIVRSCPKCFYSETAINQIKVHYPNAFKSGHGATMAWALIWIFVPTFAFTILIWPGP